MIKYSYTLLKYVHDVVRGESVNIGLLVVSAEAGFVRFAPRRELADLKQIFPSISSNPLKRTLIKLKKAFEDLALRSDAMLEIKGAYDVAFKVLPQDASSLRWSTPGSGITSDIEKTFEQLNDRLLQVAAGGKVSERRNDNAIWKIFSAELEQRNLAQYFSKQMVDVLGHNETLDHAYKNGSLHCLKPLSFDLETEQGIIDKVYKESGRFTSMTKGITEIKMYYLVGRPSNPELVDNFESATALLESNTSAKIFTEDQVKAFADYIQDNIDLHS